MISAKISFNAIDEKDRMSLVPLHNPSQIVMLLNQNKNRKSGTNPGFQQWTLSQACELVAMKLTPSDCVERGTARQNAWPLQKIIYDPISEDFNVTLMVSVKTLIMSGSRWKT